MNETGIISELVKIESWPTIGLVFAFVIVVGYCFRFWKSFPNDAIPTIVILTGAIVMLLLAPEHPKDIPARIWHVRNFVIGSIVGFGAWMGHNLIVSRIEDWLSSKFTSVSKLLGKGDLVPPIKEP